MLSRLLKFHLGQADLHERWPGQPRKWTKTMGFFALMGGFVYEKDGEFTRLDPNKPDFLHYDIYNITDEDIQDKSKGSFVSKGFAVAQTSWFTLQCIARGVEGLPITELEITTLALATLNFAIYMLWWDKPLDVQRPYRVYTREIHVDTKGTPIDATRTPVDTTRQPIRWWALWLAEVTKVHGVMVHDTIEFLFKHKILHKIDLIARPALEIVGLSWGGEGERQESHFSVGEVEEDELFYVLGPVTGLAGVIFGAVHCIAWQFQFPSHIEQALWRICAAFITCVPLYYELQGALVVVIYLLLRMHPMKQLRNFIKLAHIFTLILLALLYVLARVMLLVLTLISLRSLPPEAFQTVRWATYVPHI